MSRAQTLSQFSFLDRLFLLAESRESPLDFSVIVTPAEPVDVNHLSRGAAAARRTFPRSAGRLTPQGWEGGRFDEKVPLTDEATANLVNRWSSELGAPAVRQWVKLKPDSSQIITRFHHAACDGFSAVLWLTQQMSSLHSGPANPVVTHPAIPQLLNPPGRYKPYRPKRPSVALWSRDNQASGWRHWFTFDWPSAPLRRAARWLGVSYHDLLAACYGEALKGWNSSHAAADQPVRLWIPVNIRGRPASGFGNGTSRIRVEVAPGVGSLADRCRYLHRGIRHQFRRRDWAVPARDWFFKLPSSWQGLLLRLHLARPGVDMGTSVFSHLEQPTKSQWPDVKRLDCIGPLPRAYPMVANCVTLRDRTWCTLTYDSARLNREDVLCFQKLFQEETFQALQTPAAGPKSPDSASRHGSPPTTCCAAPSPGSSA